MKRPNSAIVIFLLVVVFIILLAPRLLQIRSLEKRNETITKELNKIQAENKALETELRLLRDDPVYLEKVARAQFNKAKQGEIVYKVVREGETSAKKA